jgi:K+-sensing histidine kinase KdpD
LVQAGGDEDSPGWMTRLVRALPDRPPSRPVGLAATLAIFAAAWAARAALDDALPPGFPYVTFFPAVVLTAFFFGVRFGALSALLCGVVAWYQFIPPEGTFKLAGTEVALGLYVFVVATDLALIHGLQVANRQLGRERRISAELAEAKQAMVDALRESEVKTRLAI